MSESFTSGSFGNIVADSSRFHDYREVEREGAGYSKFYTVISGGRKLFLVVVPAGVSGQISVDDYAQNGNKDGL